MGKIARDRAGDFLPPMADGTAQVKQSCAYIPATGQGDATKSWPVFRAPGSVAIQTVRVIPQADITGTATNYANWNLVNRGADGAGSTELAHVDFSSGTDATALDALNLYAPATELVVAADTVLALQRELVLSGLALPEALVVTEYIDLLD